MRRYIVFCLGVSVAWGLLSGLVIGPLVAPPHGHAWLPYNLAVSGAIGFVSGIFGYRRWLR